MKKFSAAFLTIVVVSVLLSPLTTFASTGGKNYFRASVAKTGYGQPVTFNWRVPKATVCYLYGPTSREPNVPDEHNNAGSVVVRPDRKYSDFEQGKVATYTLVCHDKTKLNKDGNQFEVFSKEIVIKLEKPKVSRLLDKNGAMVRPYGDDETRVFMHQPRGWKFDNETADGFDKLFKGIAIAGSLTIERERNGNLSNVAALEKDITSKFSVRNLKKGVIEIAGAPAVYVEYTHDRSRYKIFVFAKDGMTFRISAQTPTREWREQIRAINESIQTVRVQ